MSIEKVRFDDVDEEDPLAEQYHGFNLKYTDGDFVVKARFYDDEPDHISLIAVGDMAAPEREDIPYGDVRLARAVHELLAAVGVQRFVVAHRDPSGELMEVDLDRVFGGSS
jgi:hypothetical protein